MPDIPWNLVVFVFIAFVVWVWNKIQEVAAERRRRNFDKTKRAYKRQEKGLDPAEADPPNAILDVLRQLGVPVETEPEPETKSPPPLPNRQKSRPRQPDETPLMAPDKAERPTPIVPKPALPPKPKLRKIKRKRRTGRNSDPALADELRDLLRDKNSLRNVLVATEILGPPKALQEEDEVYR